VYAYFTSVAAGRITEPVGRQFGDPWSTWFCID